MAEHLSTELISELVGVELSDQDAAALGSWHAALARAVAAYPAEDLKRAEPPLRSMPGPRA